MSLKSEQVEIEKIVFRILDNLLLAVSSQTGRTGADLRRQIGRVRADYMKLLSNGGFGISLLTCFRLAEQANVKMASLAYVRDQLIKEEPSGGVSQAIAHSAISFCLATESRMITAIAYKSRDDVEAMMRKMKKAFDAARDLVADAMDSTTYRQLTFLAGSLTNHLATTSRHLPRMVKFSLVKNLPSLSASYLIYHTAERAEELAEENKIVHPAFCLREMRGLNR